MKLSDFSFELPEALIAHYPPEHRRDSRLMQLERGTGAVGHGNFTDFPSLLRSDDLLVFNNTRVIAARLFGRKASGGKVEVLLERILSGNRALAQVRASKSPRPGSQLYFEHGTGELCVEVVEREADFFVLAFPEEEQVFDILDKIGHMPLPPYIQRSDEAVDRERYQTVFGSEKGAVAAPTAGLHFDDAMLAQIRGQGIETGFVTLHVGAGTFQPVRTDNIEEHRIHKEYMEVDETLCDQVRACRARGGRVVAVGTTAVRCLESASANGEIEAMRGDTDIYIYPGYEFKTVAAMLTNLHLPESTLIMLVSAFAGRENVLAAYREAVREKYRFFSYGDAMFIA